MLSRVRVAVMSLSLLAVLLLPAAHVSAQPAGQPGQANQAADHGQWWEDFAHYVLIANTELAQAWGQKITTELTPGQFLDVVEASRHADRVDQLLLRVNRTQELSDIGAKMAQMLQTAQLERAREPERINADIQRLADGERARRNAMVRLREAGQYAAPHLLKTLQNRDQDRLHPFVLEAMTQIGRDLVYPLSVALPRIEPVLQGQVAQVLAEVGYPRALPYMKIVMESESTDNHARNLVTSAYSKLADQHRIPADATAAELFLLLGQNIYTAATENPTGLPGFDALTQKGVVWRYDRAAGLVAVPVPGPIFGDVMAMDVSHRALGLDKTMDQALSLWLMANHRRENRLPAGENDPTYPSSKWRPPAFYTQAAGALRAHDILARALEDRDDELALDAIAVLDNIAGTEVLVNREGTIQPLLWALSYPDRRVRYHAAFALTNAKPRETFVGAQRVVPVLAEAVRQSDVRHAVVIAPQETSNQINAKLADLNYQNYAGQSLAEVSDLLARGAGVDLIVTRVPVDDLSAILNQANLDHRLTAVPVVAVVDPSQNAAVNNRFRDMVDSKKLFVVAAPAEASLEQSEELGNAVSQASAAYAGEVIEPAEAESLALRSLDLLREVALMRVDVFAVSDAQPALIAALGDRRESVVEGAAGVLSLIENAEAQQAIADAALDDTRAEELRVALLGSVAEGATYYGNLLTDYQLDRLLELVKTSTGDVAVAASRAHGALTLPTSNAVELIVGSE